MLGDKRPVGLDRIPADPKNFYVPLFKFRDVSLKLNEFGRSIAAVIFGIEGQQNAAVIGEYFA